MVDHDVLNHYRYQDLDHLHHRPHDAAQGVCRLIPLVVHCSDLTSCSFYDVVRNYSNPWNHFQFDKCWCVKTNSSYHWKRQEKNNYPFAFWEILYAVWLSADFFKINILKKIFQKYQQNVKLFGSRSGRFKPYVLSADDTRTQGVTVQIQKTILYTIMFIFLLSYDVASANEITPCNKIDKPLVVYRFLGNVMTSITTLCT